MYLTLDEIKTIQLDHTSRCNLGCPQCARFHSGRGGLNPTMPITDNNLDDYKILLEPFEPDTIKLFHCGNFGDSLASPTFDETFDYCIDKKVKEVKISTNGSLRTPQWWQELAHRGKDRLKVTFSIDGLEDTNHLYRVRSAWKKIEENATAFINAGGYAQWYFIEFEHNYHQIEEARTRAADMGFKVFNVKYTGRFAEQQTLEVQNKKGEIIRDRESNHNQIDMQELKKKYISFEDYVKKTPISCKYKKEQAIFVDMCMKLWPCTWLGAPPYFDTNNVQRKSFQPMYDLYGEDFNDMRKHGWKVLEHDFFKNYLSCSWDSSYEKYPRIYTCGRTCGDKFEYSSGYGKNTKRELLNENTSSRK